MREPNDAVRFYRELKIFMLIFLILGSLVVGLCFWDLKVVMSFLVGGLLGYVNFSTLKKEGKELIFKVYTNVMKCKEKPYQKERTLFLIKVYLRLLALGIIFYFLLVKVKLDPIWLLIGFTIVYLQIFLVVLKYWIQKKESFLIK